MIKKEFVRWNCLRIFTSWIKTDFWNYYCFWSESLRTVFKRLIVQFELIFVKLVWFLPFNFNFARVTKLYCFKLSLTIKCRHHKRIIGNSHNLIKWKHHLATFVHQYAFSHLAIIWLLIYENIFKTFEQCGFFRIKVKFSCKAWILFQSLWAIQRQSWKSKWVFCKHNLRQTPNWSYNTFKA